MRVVLLRPPRFVWPFNSETSAFWQPLGLLCLAAAARRDVPDIEVEVIDAPAMKWGWRTVEQALGERRIDVLGIGEETVSAHEGLRAAALAKDLHPGCLVVAGGQYYAHAVEDALRDGAVDVVVRGEGEATFVELLHHTGDRSAWASIDGIAFRDDAGGICMTPPRRLIEDLDSLPFPAYDLIDMQRYGNGSRNHPGLVSVEHSRGCFDRCAFCILWKHMGRPDEADGDMRPHVRTQGPERSFETVARLYRDHGRRTFGWVDPTFNASPRWSDGWADLMLASDLTDPGGRPRTLHTAWMRADCVLRDEKLGILEKLVRAGLRQVMIGVERDDAAGLSYLEKHNNGAETCRAAFSLFRRKYPEVFTIGTVIFGLPGDTMGDLRRLTACEYEMGMDYCFFMPLTPNPGTAIADEAGRSARIANGDLASYNYHTPVCTTDALDLRQQESLYWRSVFSMAGRRIARLLRNLVTVRDARKRRVYLSLLRHGLVVAGRSFLHRITNPGAGAPALFSTKPSWYDE
jgi:radical SAM superfamily enzyme YgiQ (UPF0313 family)